jgi:hypothetical protein
MSEEKEFHCEFCKWYAIRKQALESDDIEFVRKVLIDFADMWLNADEDLSYHKCILDGSWITAEEILKKSLEKAKNHPNRNLE